MAPLVVLGRLPPDRFWRSIPSSRASPGSEFPLGHLFQDLDVKLLVHHQTLQPRVLVLQFLHPANRIAVHRALLGTPPVQRIFRKRGLPERIHSDNGVPFAGSGVGRLSRVSVEWMRQGIEVCRSRVGYPEDNPRHERMHRTLKARTARPPCLTASGQQRRFGDFVCWMNMDRGHEALGMRCPGNVCVASPREWQPRPAEPEYPSHWEVRRVRRKGEVNIGGGMPLITNALHGELMGLEEIVDGIWRLSYRRSALCFLDLQSGSPRVMAEPEAEDLLEDAEE